MLLLQSFISTLPVKNAQALVNTFSNGRTGYNTYFSMFNAAFWKKYTTTRDFILKINADNDGTLYLFSNGRLIEQINCHTGENEIGFDSDSIVYIETEGFKITSGGFYAKSYKENEVRLALDICTYRREEFVKANVSALKNCSCDIFVIDNGQTLGHIDGASVINNRNAGGSGGFTRGLIEIFDREYTHAVFMDDDILIAPETIERLYGYLKCVKDEYADSPVCGAMLRLDDPVILHESLATYHGLMSTSLHSGLDLSDNAQLYSLAKQEKGDYGAWWFCCVSKNAVKENGLPMPFFVRLDDVEYGLRLKPPVMLFGAAVWHEPFERKHSVGTEYYHARNALTVNSIHGEYNNAMIAFKLILGHLLRYRYTHAETALKGVDDYIKGPELLLKSDPEKINSGLAKLKTFPAPENIKIDDSPDTSIKKLISLFTFNGVWLPSKKTAYVPAHINSIVAHFKCRKVINVIADTGLCFSCERNAKRAFGLLIRTVRTCIKLKKNDTRLKNEYRAAFDTFKSRAFWNEYLK